MDINRVVNQAIGKAVTKYANEVDLFDMTQVISPKSSLGVIPSIPPHCSPFNELFGLERVVQTVIAERLQVENSEDENSESSSFREETSNPPECYICGRDFAPYWTQSLKGLSCYKCSSSFKLRTQEEHKELVENVIQKINSEIGVIEKAAHEKLRRFEEEKGRKRKLTQNASDLNRQKVAFPDVLRTIIEKSGGKESLIKESVALILHQLRERASNQTQPPPLDAPIENPNDLEKFCV